MLSVRNCCSSGKKREHPRFCCECLGGRDSPCSSRVSQHFVRPDQYMSPHLRCMQKDVFSKWFHEQLRSAKEHLGKPLYLHPQTRPLGIPEANQGGGHFGLVCFFNQVFSERREASLRSQASVAAMACWHLRLSIGSYLHSVKPCSASSHIIKALVSLVTVPWNSISIWFPIILAELPQVLRVLVKNRVPCLALRVQLSVPGPGAQFLNSS